MGKADQPLENTLFAKLLFDCMFPAELAESIRDQGFDVAEARRLPIEVQRDDYALLEEAVKEHRVLITCNYHDPKSNFCLIHDEWLRSGKMHFGIILVPQYRLSNHYERWMIRSRLLDFFNSYSLDELQNQILWLP